MSSEKNISELASGISGIADRAFDFVEKIIAGPIIEGTGAITDKIKFWRFKNQVNTILKAQEFLKEKGIKTPKKLPVKDVTTLLEYASFEEDENMQNKWACLLANAADPNNPFDICYIFSQVLNQLSPHEAKLLDYMFSRSFLMTDRDRPYFEKDDIIRRNFASYEVTLLIFDNLLRLRLIEEKPPKLQDNSRYHYRYDEDEAIPEHEIVPSNSVRLSEFGAEFTRKTHLL
ncbi:Abi-alpha family protein [Pontibacter russatus]|uniref:Abi-alpha family protein n=1 Tax=Pontibacter russatus TaxID=2694929 RepID=UPI00137A406A|nr:Abi-alpha family protein [Pontibacter russatus]